MPVPNYKQFVDTIQKAAATVPAEMITDFQIRLGLDGLRSLALLTRARTGRARGGWQVTIHKAATGETGRLDKQGTATIQAGASVLLATPPFAIVYITNNVVYIRYLNDGTERMKGDHMLERTLAILAAQFGGKFKVVQDAA